MQQQSNILDDTLMACRRILVQSVFFGFVINILVLALPIYSLQVLDRVISSGSMDTLLMLSIIIFTAFAAMSVIQTARAFALSRAGEWVEKKLSPELLKLSFSSAVTGKPSSGSQNLRDLSTIKGFLSGSALTTIIDIPWSLIFLAVLFMIHPIHGTLTLMGGAVLLALAYANDKSTKKIIEDANEGSVKSMIQIDTAMRNAEVMEAMGFSQNIINNWEKSNEESAFLQKVITNRSSIIAGTSRFIRMFVQMLIIGAGGYLVLQNELTVGAIIAGSILVGRALAPFETSIASWKGVIGTYKAYTRLKENITKMASREDSMQLPKPQGYLDVENVFFALSRDSKPILNNVSFSLEPGEIVGIIGNSASGKSTLAKIISGVYKPVRGIVRLDKADIYTWNRNDIGHHLGYLPQDVELFEGTIKENIARMDRNANPANVVRAAKIAGVHEMILQLPKGYETEIGIGGTRLSGGQRQRVALARAFYGSPKLIVMDEPNSNLDMAGDVALANALKYAKANKITTIVISHKPTIMNSVDKIIMMKDGMASQPESPQNVIRELNKNLQQNNQTKVA